MVRCSNCDAACKWSENPRLNSRGEMKYFLIDLNSEQPHRCMGWQRQGYRDARIPPPSVWTAEELAELRASNDRITEEMRAEMRRIFKSPYIDKDGNLIPDD